MNEVYILTIVKETADAHPEVEVSAYRSMDSAIRGFDAAVEGARCEVELYGSGREDIGICTDTYRSYRIKDIHNDETITIELQTREFIEDEPDDI